MIITLTLNPAIDKTVTLNQFDAKQMNRVVDCHQDPGGKGINVSKVIHALGGKSSATGIVAGSTGQFIRSALEGKGIDTQFIEVEGETRTNLKVFCKATRETIEINESGPSVSSEKLHELERKMVGRIQAGDICVIAGSLPLGVEKSYYFDLVSRLKGAGAKVILDADGELFKIGVQAKPDYIKPNLKELESYFGRAIPPEDHESLKRCAKDFLEMGIAHVIFSLGAQGAFYMDAHKAYRVYPIQVEAHSSVGAGDAFVGALAYSLQEKLPVLEMLRLATATSAGAVMTVGTNPADLQWIESHKMQVNIQEI